MANYNRLGKNIISLTIGSFATKILNFLFVPFYTAILSTEEYGTADLIATTVSLLFPFFTCVICEAMLRFTQNDDQREEDVYVIGTVVWAVGFLILLLLSPIILLIPTLKKYWLLIILYYIAYSLYTNIGYYIRGIGKVVIFSISGIVNTVIAVVLNILFLLVLKIGVEGYLLAYIIAHFVSIIYMIHAVKLYKIKVFRRSFNFDLLKKMLLFSMPLIPNSASWWISNSSDKYILTYFAGVSINGIYSVAYKIPTIMSMFTGIFNMAWRLSAVEKFGSEESKKFYSNVFDMYITMTACMASLLMLLNKMLSGLLYSKDFYQAWKYVPVLLVAAMLQSYSDFFGTIYTSAYKTNILFYSTLAGAITNISLNFLLIPKYGAMGAAVATMVSYLVTFLIRFVDSRKIMKLIYEVISDLSCVAIILVQLIIATMTVDYEYLISFVCFSAMFFIRRKSIYAVSNMVFHKLKR